MHSSGIDRLRHAGGTCTGAVPYPWYVVHGLSCLSTGATSVDGLDAKRTGLMMLWNEGLVDYID